MIEVRELTKRYGKVVAVDKLSFTVRPGIVTGFLGPNGAGKSTTMRVILGLDNPTSGDALIEGRHLLDAAKPLAAMGALLDAKQVHPNRSARNHLLVVAASNGLPAARADECLELVGLTSVAKRKAGGFSLGMSQRLGIATALLGDPKVLMFDEPLNGLDPEGIHWVRQFLRALASEGRTVLVSSHLMSEMAQTADHLVVIGRGALIADESMNTFLGRSQAQYVKVRSPRATELAELLSPAGARVSPGAGGMMNVAGASPEQIGDAAAAAGIPLYELMVVGQTLEDVFLALTGDSSDYHTGGVH